MEVLEEGAFGTGFIAGEGKEDRGLDDVIAEDKGETATVVEVRVLPFHAFAEGVEAELEEAGLDGADAGEAPGGDGELFDEEGLGGGGGPVFVDEGLDEGLVGGPVLDVDDGVLGGERCGRRRRVLRGDWGRCSGGHCGDWPRAGEEKASGKPRVWKVGEGSG